ncbi:MAG: class I SAM-dependent methyltransferase [Bacteroidetes bacterium]|nr:class I SAM-dependent methyltransferase [Bacteroidota bacterium]
MKIEEKIQEENYFKFRNIGVEYYDTYDIPNYLMKVLPSNKDAKILDIGCGFGQTLKSLRDKGYKNLKGIDINDESIAQCKEINLDVTKVDDIISYTKSSDKKYDFIIMSHVLEHIEKDKMIDNLRAIRSLLSTEGKYCVMVPNAQSNTGSYWRFEDFTHHYLFTSGSLLYVLKAAGFTKIDFVDPDGLDGVSSFKKPIVKILLKIYRLRKNFWNKITASSYHRPSPQIFTFELKAIAS